MKTPSAQTFFPIVEISAQRVNTGSAPLEKVTQLNSDAKNSQLQILQIQSEPLCCSAEATVSEIRLQVTGDPLSLLQLLSEMKRREWFARNILDQAKYFNHN